MGPQGARVHPLPHTFVCFAVVAGSSFVPHLLLRPLPSSRSSDVTLYRKACAPRFSPSRSCSVDGAAAILEGTTIYGAFATCDTSHHALLWVNVLFFSFLCVRSRVRNYFALYDCVRIMRQPLFILFLFFVLQSACIFRVIVLVALCACNAAI